MEQLSSLREYINQNSSGAHITFYFIINKVDYNCINVEDFISGYGTRSAYLLDSYYVKCADSNYHGPDQGSTQRLTLISKEKYEEEVRLQSPSTFTNAQADLISKYYSRTEDLLIGNTIIRYTGTGFDVMDQLIKMIDALPQKKKDKIRSIFLGHKYRSVFKE